VSFADSHSHYEWTFIRFEDYRFHHLPARNMDRMSDFL